MKISEILEMDNIEKRSLKIVNTTNNTVKYVVKRVNIFGELALHNKEAAFA